MIPAFLLLEPENLIRSETNLADGPPSDDDAATVSFKTITIRSSFGRDVRVVIGLCLFSLDQDGS